MKSVKSIRVCLKCRKEFANRDTVMDYRICQGCRDTNPAVLISSKFSYSGRTGKKRAD